MTQVKKEFIWRGSQLSADIVTHDDNGVLTPCLQIMYRARIPLRGSDLVAQKERAQGIADAVSRGLVELPTIDELKVWAGSSLRASAHRGRRNQT